MSQDFFLLNKQGFIPGPQETEAEFYERIEFCRHLLTHLAEESEATQLPFEEKDLATKTTLEEAFDLTNSLYGIQPEWVPLFFSNHQLTPWHGGCAWIFQLNEHTPLAAFLQLRAHFRHFATYLRVYYRKELIAHELSHVGRLMLDEPQFEEFFAYQSSPYAWRRWLGPLIQSSTESLFFILLLGLIFIVDLAILGTGHSTLSSMTNWLKLVPLFFIFYAFIRLTQRHWTLQQCLKNLKFLTHSSNQASHLLYRLCDSEIRQFAKESPENIKKFIENQSFHSFRWSFLSKLYIKS
jgi:hypothetical protein